MSARTDETLIQLSAGELAAAIARGEVSATEAVEAHIARIEEVNGALNAVVVKRYNEARAEARAADETTRAWRATGPAAGVPITIKESFDLAGTPSTFGISSAQSILATQDDLYVARLRAPGRSSSARPTSRNCCSTSRPTTRSMAAPTTPGTSNARPAAAAAARRRSSRRAARHSASSPTSAAASASPPPSAASPA